MNLNMLEAELREFERQLEKLFGNNYIEGRDTLKGIYAKLGMIIRRIYPNYKEVQVSLIGRGYYLG